MIRDANAGSCESACTAPHAHIFGFIDTYSIGNFTVRAAYQHTKHKGGGDAAAAPFRQLAAGLALQSAAAAAQANELYVTERTYLLSTSLLSESIHLCASGRTHR